METKTQLFLSGFKVAKIKCYKLTFLLIAVFLIGCTSQQEIQRQEDEQQRLKNEEEAKIMDSWKGTHKSALIQSWGPPTRYSPDGQGGEILIYEYPRNVGLNMYGTYVQRTLVDYREMFANKDGIIYYWRKGRR